MALPPTTPNPSINREDEVLIREIDEAVREDAALEFFRRHGVKLLIALGVLIAGMLAYWWWDSRTEAALEKQSETIISALDYAAQRDFKTASEKVAPLIDDSSASPGARAAARFLVAGAALEERDTEKAAGLYKAIADDSSAPAVLRDLARIREVTIAFDRMKPADVIARLSPLAQAGNPYFGSAGELVAMAHLENGNRAAAGKLFAAIAKDEDQPETLRSRARQMAGLLGVDAVVDVNKLLEDQGVAGSGEEGTSPAEAR